jgi:hypothetical protein
MSSDHTSPDAESDQALLCWSEPPTSPWHEEFVQVLKTHLSEAVIKSAFKVNEKTKVTLIGKDYTGIGIVKSCEEDGKNFILTVLMGEQKAAPISNSPSDPGALLVDQFTTEEQEAKILQDLEDSIPRRFSFPKLCMALRCLLPLRA